ncbi:MAG: LysE family transporter [Desulfosporosinus sp.]|nr:LysE family transporter [Desulfosporosinus sp.]
MMIFRGFKFGMLLQLAIGPVCLFVFKVGGNKGFIRAEIGVLGVAVADAFYILLAISGIVSCIERERVKYIFKNIGAIIVAIFGIQIILGVFGREILPNINLLTGIKSESSFLEGFLITASNPLTILFWAGIFSSNIAEEKLIRKDIYLFGLGSVISTLFFLTIIAGMGTVTGYFLPVKLISILNFIVGVVLLFFSFRMILKKDRCNC